MASSSLLASRNWLKLVSESGCIASELLNILNQVAGYSPNFYNVQELLIYTNAQLHTTRNFKLLLILMAPSGCLYKCSNIWIRNVQSDVSLSGSPAFYLVNILFMLWFCMLQCLYLLNVTSMWMSTFFWLLVWNDGVSWQPLPLGFGRFIYIFIWDLMMPPWFVPNKKKYIQGLVQSSLLDMPNVNLQSELGHLCGSTVPKLYA